MNKATKYLLSAVIVGAVIVFIWHQIFRLAHEDSQTHFGNPESPAPELSPTGKPGRILSQNQLWNVHSYTTGIFPQAEEGGIKRFDFIEFCPQKPCLTGPYGFGILGSGGDGPGRPFWFPISVVMIPGKSVQVHESPKTIAVSTGAPSVQWTPFIAERLSHLRPGHTMRFKFRAILGNPQVEEITGAYSHHPIRGCDHCIKWTLSHRKDIYTFRNASGRLEVDYDGVGVSQTVKNTVEVVR